MLREHNTLLFIFLSSFIAYLSFYKMTGISLTEQYHPIDLSRESKDLFFLKNDNRWIKKHTLYLFSKFSHWSKNIFLDFMNKKLWRDFAQQVPFSWNFRWSKLMYSFVIQKKTPEVHAIFRLSMILFLVLFHSFDTIGKYPVNKILLSIDVYLAMLQPSTSRTVPILPIANFVNISADIQTIRKTSDPNSMNH